MPRNKLAASVHIGDLLPKKFGKHARLTPPHADVETTDDADVVRHVAKPAVTQRVKGHQTRERHEDTCRRP